MKRQLNLIALVVGAVVVVACQSKGPAPAETPSASEAPPTSAAAADPHAGMGTQGDPHAGMAPASPHGGAVAAPNPDASGRLDIGAISFKVPDAWKVEQPTSGMRRAQLSASGSAGDAELIAYFFGPQGAGSASANIERWVAQFTKEDGSPITDAKPVEDKVAGLKTTKLEVAGRYAGGMAAGGQPRAKSDQRLIAAIVESPGGPYYFKLLGPDASVAENRAAFEALLASIERSP